MRNLVYAAVVVTAPFAAVLADTAVWGGDYATAERGDVEWANANTWVGGVVPADGDDVDMTYWPGTKGDKSYLEAGIIPNGTHSYGAVYGTYGRILRWNGYGGDTYVLSFTNTCDYAGGFDLYGWGTLNFASPLGFSPCMSSLRVQDALNINVPTGGVTATVSSLYGGGTVWKRGEGSLVIGRVQPGTRINVTAGTVSVGGHGEDTAILAAALAKAAFHVDASAEGTVETNAAGEVTRWSDVRADCPVYAYRGGRGTAQTYNLPTVAANFQNGLPVIDFGEYGIEADANDSSKSTAALRFSKLFEDVKDAFFVEADRYETITGTGSEMHPHLFAVGINHKTLMRNSGGRLVSSTPGVTTGNARITNPLDLVDADFRIDGASVDPRRYIFSGTELKVVGYTPRETAAYCPMEMFASDYGARFGGIRVGEALVFTNKLTEAERSAITRHLLAKWKPAAVKPDLEALNIVHSNATTLNVAAGDTLSVGVIRTASTAPITKTGEGTLSVGRVDGAAAVDVQGGSLTFGAAALPSANPQPAANPYRHYDASDADSVHYTEDPDTGDKLVTSWDDQSGDAAKVATAVTVTSTGRTIGSPKYRTGVQNGRAVIDFGVVVQGVGNNAPDSGAMQFDSGNPAPKKLREVFFVYRKTASGDGVPAQAVLFGCHLNSGSDHYQLFPHYNNYYMFRPSMASPYAIGARWTFDGSPHDSMASMYPYVTSYHVYHATFAQDMIGTTFFLDRGGADKVGGGLVGEVIIYDRELTEQERVDTEAYLVKRWLAKDHPASTPPPAVSYATAGETKIGVEAGRSVTLTNLSAVSGSFVKTGGGALDVSVPIASARDIVVEGGTLVLAVNTNPPAFHFDASDMSSLSYFVEDGVTNVTAWADTRGNGLVANAVAYKFSVTNPTLMTVVRADGKARPCLDFGKKNDTNSAGMQMSTAFSNIREAHCVFTDANGANTMFVFTDINKYNYHRYGNQISRTGDPEFDMVGNGIIEADSVAKTKTYIPKGSFEVLSFVPTANTTIGSIALDRSSSAGGCRISEMVGFTAPQPEAARHNLERMLMAKWGTVAGMEKTLLTNEFESVTLKNGATFRPVDDLAPEFVLKLGAVSGDGTIDAAGVCLADGATLAATVTGAVAPLSVAGAFASEGSVSLSVTVGKAPGTHGVTEYAILSAEDVSGVDLSGWTVSVTGLRASYGAELAKSGNKIVLRVSAPGMFMLVR